MIPCDCLARLRTIPLASRLPLLLSEAVGHVGEHANSGLPPGPTRSASEGNRQENQEQHAEHQVVDGVSTFQERDAARDPRRELLRVGPVHSCQALKPAEVIGRQTHPSSRASSARRPRASVTSARSSRRAFAMPATWFSELCGDQYVRRAPRLSVPGVVGTCNLGRRSRTPRGGPPNSSRNPAGPARGSTRPPQCHCWATSEAAWLVASPFNRIPDQTVTKDPSMPVTPSSSP